MQLIDLSSLCCFIVFAHVIECKVYILRDYDDEPVFIVESRGNSDHTVGTNLKDISTSSYRPKRNYKRNTKHAVLHYGRHIYHLDTFEDLTKLRSKLAANPNYISYDYLDFNDLFKSNDHTRSIPWDYIILKASPKLIKCKGEDCDENLRKYSDAIKKIKQKKKMADPIEKWKSKRMPLGKHKRFKIIDNRHKQDGRKPKKFVEYSEEAQAKTIIKKYSSESNSESKESKESRETQSKSKESRESKSKESAESKHYSNSRERSSNKKKRKTIYDPNYSSSEESTEYTTKRPKKYDSHSESLSWEEKWEKNINSDSNSIENSRKKKFTKKKGTPGSSDETKRKTFDKDDETIIQGNKIYNVNSMDDELEDKRRRLPQFLPKRFHWDASQIHDLGYYWFNGPRGRYPEPKTLLQK